MPKPDVLPDGYGYTGLRFEEVANKMLDHVMRPSQGYAYDPPDILYASLWTDFYPFVDKDYWDGWPGDFVEVAAADYARVPIPNNTTVFPHTEEGWKACTKNIVFTPSAKYEWGEIVCLVLMDSPTGGYPVFIFDFEYNEDWDENPHIYAGADVRIPANKLQFVEYLQDEEYYEDDPDVWVWESWADGEKSKYLQNKMLNHLLGKEIYTPPDKLYIALFTQDWDTLYQMSTRDFETNFDFSTELTGEFYRYELNNNTIEPVFAAASGRRKHLAYDIWWARLITAFGWDTQVKSWALMDAETGGNALYIGDAAFKSSFRYGDVVRIDDGGFTIEEDGDNWYT